MGKTFRTPVRNRDYPFVREERVEHRKSVRRSRHESKAALKALIKSSSK